MNELAEQIFHFELTVSEAVINLFFALICGVIVAYVYQRTYRGVNYSANNVIAIIMLALITALVIMVIGSNLARAFGLVGAMSIIRFRTAVKDTQDIMFIFFALAVGLGCGAGMFLITFVGTLFIASAAWLAVLVHGENPRKREYLLQLQVNTSSSMMDILENTLAKNTRSYKLINIKSVGEESKGITELTYYVRFSKIIDSNRLISSLKQLSDVIQVNLFFDED